MIVRFGYIPIGDHVHVRVYMGSEPETLMQCGFLDLDESHFNYLRSWLGVVAATLSLTRVDAAAGLKIELYLIDESENLKDTSKIR